LLEARAIENLAYVVGVNRTGSDPDFPYPGQSRIIDPLGEVLANAGPEAGMIRSEIKPELIRKWRHDFPAYQDSLELKARGF
jgi:predicted amidohydrolase